MGKVARTKQYENTETPFENPTYDARFDSYPAVAYYKMVPADKTLFPVCVAETMDWYKEGTSILMMRRYLHILPKILPVTRV